MRKPAVVAGIAIAVIVVVVAVFAATFNVNRYRGTIQSSLSNSLGRNVTLGQMHLSILPPGVSVSDLRVADDPRFQTQKPFVEAQRLQLAVKVLPLLRKSVEIRSLSLEQPSVELIKNQQGVWNFASLGGSASSSGGAGSGGTNRQQQLSLDKLAVQNGRIAVTNLQAQAPRSVYDHIDFTLVDLAPGRPFSISAAAHLPGPGDQAIKLEGKGGPIRQDMPAATSFHGTLDVSQVAIANARQWIDSPALATMDGTVAGQTVIGSDSGKLAAKGNLTIQNAQVNKQSLGYPIAVQYNLNDDVSGEIVTVNNAVVKLGATPLTVSGTINYKPTPAQIDLHATAGNVSLAEAARLAAASGTVLTAGATVNGTLNANLEIKGAATNPALSGSVNGRDIRVSGKDFPQPVQVPALDLALTPDEIRSSPFTVTSAGASLNAGFTLQRYLSNTPAVDVTLRATNAQLPAILSMAKAYGITALNNVSGAGALNLDLHATGPLRLRSQAEIARDLNGTASLNLQNVRYTGTDINHNLAAIAGILGIHSQDQGFTTINKMTGNIVIKNGIAQTNNMQALLDLGNVGVAGTANLADQTLNLRVTAVLSKDTSQKSGGTNISGYLRTALANKQGELVIPAIVTGTFQHPQFAPDLQQIAQMKLKGLAPDFNNPAGALSGILGNVLGQQGGNQSQQERSREANPLQQLQGLFGQQQQQPPPKQ